MPDKPLTIATYAAGASLAAITLIYVFGPTYFLDSDTPSSSSLGKKGVVGLSNPANDCFINSILQTLAGLSDLRLYLIRETHRRTLDGDDVYRLTAANETDILRQLPAGKGGARARAAALEARLRKLEGLRAGIVTLALKTVLDRLNERPICKKTISAQEFVGELERAFRTRISRQQQDAQEFLQIVTERLCDEYHAGKKARKRVLLEGGEVNGMVVPDGLVEENGGAGVNGDANLPGHGMKKQPANHNESATDEEEHLSTRPERSSHSRVDEKLPRLTEDELAAQVEETLVLDRRKAQSDPAEEEEREEEDEDVDEEEGEGEIKDEDEDDEEGFPFEGQLESQIECMTCHFKPKPSVSTFVTLTLNVPQCASTALNSCFDGMLKVEQIDDYKCDHCRLTHAIATFQSQLAKCTADSASAAQTSKLSTSIAALQTALATDPEHPPASIALPDSKLAPRRTIQRHSSISAFPKILAIHLSRSLYSATSLSTKNTAKVAFPELLPLGGLLPNQRRRYRLVATVTHKGGHNSGHYESFRRQVTGSVGPYSTPNSMGVGGVYSRMASKAPSPVVSAGQSPGMQSVRSSVGESVSGCGSGNGNGNATRAASRVEQLAREDPDPGQRPALASTSSSSVRRASSSPELVASSSRSSLSLSSGRRRREKERERALPPTSNPRPDGHAAPSPDRVSGKRPGSAASRASKALSPMDIVKLNRARWKRDNKWWRISDDKVKESKTSDVLGMQKEVYLLFYELDRRGDDGGGLSGW